MKILIPLAEGFEELEAIAVWDILKRAGVQAVLAGIPGTIIRGKNGLQVTTEAKLADLRAEELDGVVLPGGWPGYENLASSHDLKELVLRLAEEKKLIAAICGAPTVLARWGLLDERKAAVYPGLEREILRPRGDRVVKDENFITSKGPGTAVEFALEIVEYLLGKEKRQEVERQIAYERA